MGDSKAAKDMVMGAVRAHFRPEFINRIDELIVFDALNQEEIQHIVRLQVKRVQERLSDKKIHLQLTDRIRPRVRRAAAKTGNPTPIGKSAGQRNLGRPLPAGQYNQNRCCQRRPYLQQISRPVSQPGPKSGLARVQLNFHRPP